MNNETDYMSAVAAWCAKAYFLLSRIHDSGNLYIFQMKDGTELTPYEVAMEYDKLFPKQAP